MAKVNYVRYSITFAFFAVLNIEVSISDGYRNFVCDQVGRCQCKKLSGDLIDLSPLEDIVHPEFFPASNNRGVYFYHPCSDFSLPTAKTTGCSDPCSVCFFEAATANNTNIDANAVLIGNVPGKFHCLAHAAQATFQPSEADIHLAFRTINVTTIINLECDDSRKARTVLSLKDPSASLNLSYHNLVLSSPYSCFRGDSHEKHYISGFGVFCLILITIASAYFFGGMLVLRYIKGATGTEMIPNYDFWVSLPSRVKNGFMRLIGKGNPAGDSYESI